jgi:hypothetical protein
MIQIQIITPRVAGNGDTGQHRPSSHNPVAEMAEDVGWLSNSHLCQTPCPLSSPSKWDADAPSPRGGFMGILEHSCLLSPQTPSLEKASRSLWSSVSETWGSPSTQPSLPHHTNKALLASCVLHPRLAHPSTSSSLPPPFVVFDTHKTSPLPSCLCLP